jgi:toxin ParE1/3/4
VKRIRFSRAAERDLDTIWYYVAKKSGSAEIADRLLDSITATLTRLARAPEAGTKRDHVMPGLRGFPVGNYIVCYAETERRILVSRILHGMRDQRSAYQAGTRGS